jgi:hypothetical protein
VRTSGRGGVINARTMGWVQESNISVVKRRAMVRNGREEQRQGIGGNSSDKEPKGGKGEHRAGIRGEARREVSEEQ